MYKNIGGKIKVLAVVIFILTALASVVSGIVLIAVNRYMILIGLAILFGGPLVCWILSWFLYGYGELISKACEIELNTRKDGSRSIVQTAADSQRIAKIKKLRAEGLINEEEYNQLVSRIYQEDQQ